MFSFKVLKKSKRSLARIGVISTPHGDIETPMFIPVATRGSVRLVENSDLFKLGAQMLICNTFHLHLTPGEQIIKKAGGLHAFMNWQRPLMTDSGGFQVFSLGFGRDHGMGKMLKETPQQSVTKGARPDFVKITDEGVHFRSPRDGAKLFLGPKESIKIQETLGADIILAFDECPSPLADAEYMRISLEKTHRWAADCLKFKKNNKQALYGIVQGGSFRDLRELSARIIGAMPFEGFGIGGEFGYKKKDMEKMLGWVNAILPSNKPRHVLGIGHPADFKLVARSGGDTFDCIAPTHYARRGTVFTSKGKLDLNKSALKQQFRPIDSTCTCLTCKNYTRAYLSHLIRSNELTGLTLATIHNLHFFTTLAKKVRDDIANGDL